MIRTLFFSKSKAPNFFEIVVHYFQIKRSPKCALFGIKCEKLRQSLGFTPSCRAYDAPHRPTSCLHATRNHSFGSSVLAVTPLGRSSRLCLTSMVAKIREVANDPLLPSRCPWWQTYHCPNLEAMATQLSRNGLEEIWSP